MPARHESEKEHRGAYESAAQEYTKVVGAWRKPRRAVVTHEDGRKERIYQCLVCRDIGTVSLPKVRENETEEQLIEEPGPAGVVYHCPQCRRDAAPYRVYVNQEDLAAGKVLLPGSLVGRLDHWLALRQQQLKEEADGAPPPRTLSELLAGAKGIAAQMPALSGAEKSEISQQAREAQ